MWLGRRPPRRSERPSRHRFHGCLSSKKKRRQNLPSHSLERFVTAALHINCLPTHSGPFVFCRAGFTRLRRVAGYPKCNRGVYPERSRGVPRRFFYPLGRSPGLRSFTRPACPELVEGSSAEGSRRHSLSAVCLRQTLQFPPVSSLLRVFVVQEQLMT